MGMTEDDKRNCCLVEIQETEAKYYKTLEDIEKVRAHEMWGSQLPSVSLPLLPSLACGPSPSMEMSAICALIGGRKCHRSRSIGLLLAQLETPGLQVQTRTSQP